VEDERGNKLKKKNDWRPDAKLQKDKKIPSQRQEKVYQAPAPPIANRSGERKRFYPKDGNRASSTRGGNLKT